MVLPGCLERRFGLTVRKPLLSKSPLSWIQKDDEGMVKVRGRVGAGRNSPRAGLGSEAWDRAEHRRHKEGQGGVVGGQNKEASQEVRRESRIQTREGLGS